MSKKPKDQMVSAATLKNRVTACECAARLMADEDRGDGAWVNRLWSATVFFESYIATGSSGTRKNFGPKKPAKLKQIRSVT